MCCCEVLKIAIVDLEEYGGVTLSSDELGAVQVSCYENFGGALGGGS